MAKSKGISGFGSSLKRGDGAAKTLTLASVLAADTVVINGLTFTAHTDTTTVANREFAINGASDALDAAELVTCINDATYGVPNVTAVDNSDGTITLQKGADVTVTITDGTNISSADATETFTAVGEINNIDLSGFSTEMIDVTHMESPSNYREKRPTFLDAGTLTAEMNFVPSDSQQDPSTGFLSDFEDRLQRNYQLVFPDNDSTTMNFAAYVSSFAVSAPSDGKLGATLTLDIDGAVTWS